MRRQPIATATQGIEWQARVTFSFLELTCLLRRRRVELDDKGEDEQMLGALVSKFDGQPMQLEQAVANVAKMASELAPGAVEVAGAHLYTEKEQNLQAKAAAEQTSKGGARRRVRPVHKADG